MQSFDHICCWKWCLWLLSGAEEAAKSNSWPSRGDTWLLWALEPPLCTVRNEQRWWLLPCSFLDWGEAGRVGGCFMARGQELPEQDGLCFVVARVTDQEVLCPCVEQAVYSHVPVVNH